MLPEFVDRSPLHGVRLADGLCDLQLTREDEQARVEVLRAEGVDVAVGRD